MDKADETKFRAALMARLEAIDLRTPRPFAGGTSGRAMQQQPKREERSGLAAERKRIGEAIRRLDGGTYAKCMRCDGSIENGRLERDPAETHCAKCGGDQQ